MTRLMRSLVIGLFLQVSLCVSAFAVLDSTTSCVPGRLKVRLHPHMSAYQHRMSISNAGLTLLHPVLPYRSSITATVNQTVRTALLNINEVLRLEEQLLRSFVVGYSNNTISPQQMCAQLRAGCSDFEIVEPVFVGEITGKSNDPLVDTQLMMPTIKAFEAWDVEDGGESVVIGIIDTGVLQVHEDLRDALHINVLEIENNGIDDDVNGYIDDYSGYNFCSKDDGTLPGNTTNAREGHGTGVAGIAAARVNNGVGIAGVANTCKIFPLKTMPDYISGIVYGYEAMIYCATNGVDVVNCSWGSGSKSCIDSTVVAYTIARGTAIVASAGNHGTSASFYPAAYPGVLSVGVSDPEDSVQTMSAFGSTVDVMAPGHATITTSNDSTYGGFCCTSGAAPIVSGVVALVRSKYPLLGPIEATALVREAIDESPWSYIPPSINPVLLPRGRVNVLKAVTLRPDSIPSLEFGEPRILSTSADGRWTVGDTLEIAVTAANVLGPWTAIRISGLDVTSSVSSPGISIINGTERMIEQQLAHNDQLAISGIRCVVDRATDTTAFVIGTVEGRTPSGDTVRRPLRVPVTPAPSYLDMQNTVLLLSVGDKVRIGNTDLIKGQGSGLRYKQWCGQLYEGGMMITANGRVVDAVRAMKGIDDHFVPIKRFIRPDPYIGIARDDNAPDSLRIGVEIEQHVRIASADSGLFVNDITITNTSSDTLYDLSVAYFYDWDVGAQPAQNTVRLELIGRQFGIEAIETTNSSEPKVLCGVDSEHPDAVSTCAGIDNTATYRGLSLQRKMELLYSGKTEQYTGINDVAVVSGMRFMLPVAPGERRSFRHVIAIDTSLERARNLVLGEITSVSTTEGDSELHIFPNPVDDVVHIRTPSSATASGSISIIDIQGRVVAKQSLKERSLMPEVVIGVHELAAGPYYIFYEDFTARIATTFLVVH